MTGRGFRCGNTEMGQNTSVILPLEHRRHDLISCDKVSQRRPGNPPPSRRRRNAAGGSLTLTSPTALLSSAPEWQAQFYKTKLCPFYVRDIPDAISAQEASAQLGHNVGSATGVCINREACRFAHSYEELRPLPDLRKTKLCSSYTKKSVCKNSKCPFAHSPNELRTSSSVFYKVTLCNFYKNGRCWNGSNCRFAHGNDELRLSDLPQSAAEDDDELVSITTTATRPKKLRRPTSRDKTDGLLPTPADCTRLGYDKQPLHKVRTAASTTSNSATTTPPRTAAVPQQTAPSPPAPFPDTETLINLVTQKLLEPSGSPPVETSPPPPGFGDRYIDPSDAPLELDAEALVSLLLAATANNQSDLQTHHQFYPSPSQPNLLHHSSEVPADSYRASEHPNLYSSLSEPAQQLLTYNDSYLPSHCSSFDSSVATLPSSSFALADNVGEPAPRVDGAYEPNPDDQAYNMIANLLRGLSFDEIPSFY